MQTVWIDGSDITPTNTNTLTDATIDKPSHAAQRGVIVFALGWAGSDELVRHLALPSGYDLLCLFDYRTIPSDATQTEWFERLQSYDTRHLMAWSFGVWAADTLFDSPTFRDTQTPFWKSATAINGTPIPISDRYGIPQRAFALTLRNIIGAGMLKFLERMCGTPETLQFYYRHRSTRPLDDIYDELQALQEQSNASTMALPSAGFWTQAIIGSKDVIFPPKNMERYWAEAQLPSSGITLIKDMPHYPLHDAEILTTIITPNDAR